MPDATRAERIALAHIVQRGGELRHRVRGVQKLLAACAPDTFDLEMAASVASVAINEPDPAFAEKFKRLDTVSSSEFHTYTVADLVLPKRETAG